MDKLATFREVFRTYGTLPIVSYGAIVTTNRDFVVNRECTPHKIAIRIALDDFLRPERGWRVDWSDGMPFCALTAEVFPTAEDAALWVLSHVALSDWETPPPPAKG
jgi:hypothetical protein